MATSTVRPEKPNRSKRIHKAGRRGNPANEMLSRDKGDDLFKIQAGIDLSVFTLEVNLTSRLEEAKLTECGKVVAVTAEFSHLCLILLGHVVEEGDKELQQTAVLVGKRNRNEARLNRCLLGNLAQALAFLQRAASAGCVRSWLISSGTEAVLTQHIIHAA